MHNFKPNDTVLCVKADEHNVLAVGETYSIVWVTEHYVYVADDTGVLGGYMPERFTLVQNANSELPPVPDSALYINAVKWGIKLDVTGNNLLISTGNPNNLNSRWTGATMCPDIALQLAHDLTRMAMELKRK